MAWFAVFMAAISLATSTDPYLCVRYENPVGARYYFTTCQPNTTIPPAAMSGWDAVKMWPSPPGTGVFFCNCWGNETVVTNIDHRSSAGNPCCYYSSAPQIVSQVEYFEKESCPPNEEENGLPLIGNWSTTVPYSCLIVGPFPVT